MKGKSCAVSDVKTPSHIQLEMPSSKSAEKALELISHDKSKVLGLTVGKHNVTPGQHVPKAGKLSPW
jgi:hypothetical protein